MGRSLHSEVNLETKNSQDFNHFLCSYFLNDPTELNFLWDIALIPGLCFLLGEYFFELDDKSVLPGYPKLIEDVWGIPGPIDAAFTRINCQGKTYIFKVCLSGNSFDYFSCET